MTFFLRDTSLQIARGWDLLNVDHRVLIPKVKNLREVSIQEVRLLLEVLLEVLSECLALRTAVQRSLFIHICTIDLLTLYSLRSELQTMQVGLLMNLASVLLELLLLELQSLR